MNYETVSPKITFVRKSRQVHILSHACAQRMMLKLIRMPMSNYDIGSISSYFISYVPQGFPKLLHVSIPMQRRDFSLVLELNE